MTRLWPMRHVRSLLPAAALLISLAVAPLTATAATDLAIGGTAVVAYANGDNVRVRTAPGYDAGILTEIAEGSSVAIIDGVFTASDGTLWYQVDANGVTGYMVADYLASSGAAFTAPWGEAVTIDEVNVRSGPSLADPILGTASAGQWFTLTGENVNGWLSINYGEYTGYVYSEFISQDPAAPVDEPAPAEPTPDTSGETGTRYTNDSVNLRSGPGLDQGVITVLPAGVELWLTGAQENGFAQVTGGSGDGWVAVEYLSVEAPAAPAEPAPEAPTDPAPEAPPPVGSSIIWPVSGGEWSVLQGYNGSSHYDSGLWQYQDSLDIVRTDGNTGGQPLYSPVNGTIRWFDPSTGGIAIDMGNGYAFAIFHAYYDPSLTEGQALTQGQYIGTVAPDGEASNGGIAHPHLSLWSTSDGGNWDRTSEPFVGANAISGMEFYNSGVPLEHTGTIFYP